jgi:hypothetical protein
VARRSRKNRRLISISRPLRSGTVAMVKLARAPIQKLAKRQFLRVGHAVPDALNPILVALQTASHCSGSDNLIKAISPSGFHADGKLACHTQRHESGEAH